jgi:hypothetical protein
MSYIAHVRRLDPLAAHEDRPQIRPIGDEVGIKRRLARDPQRKAEGKYEPQADRRVASCANSSRVREPSNDL